MPCNHRDCTGSENGQCCQGNGKKCTCPTDLDEVLANRGYHHFNDIIPQTSQKKTRCSLDPEERVLE